MSDKTTPRPWRLGGGRVISGPDEVWVTDLDPDTALHDAQLIVQAVNAHEALVEALEAITLAAEKFSPALKRELGTLYTDAKAALAGVPEKKGETT